MTSTAFQMLYKVQPVLGEGAVIERLRRNSDFELDPHIVNSAFIYDQPKRESLAAIYRQYLDIGRQFDLPLILPPRPGGPVRNASPRPDMRKRM